MLTDVISETTSISERKALGQKHLAEGHIFEAITVYFDLLTDAPQDASVYFALGEIYRRNGDDKLALLMYGQARHMDPSLPQVDERIAYLSLPGRLPGNSQAHTPLPEPPESIASLPQPITRQELSVSDAEIERAAALLQKILASPQPARIVAEHLDEIDSLLPALIALNIRQARADGAPELAAGLEELLMNIHLQVQQRGQPAASALAHPGHPPRSGPAILILNPEARETNARMALAAESLQSAGCQVRFTDRDEVDLSDPPDVVIANNPHTSPQMMKALAVYAAAGTPIVHDLDQDFEEMPSNHPDYERWGLGKLATARAYMASLMLANYVTVPNATLAEALTMARCPVRVMPDGWSSHNPLWQILPPRRSTLNLAWMGVPGHADDVYEIRRLVMRIMRAFMQTQLVVAGDAAVYHLFESLPEARKLYLPAASVEESPYSYAQIDVLLMPLRNIPFNRAQSDRYLVEAGVRQIPWLASPIPAVRNWAEGGLIADTDDEWYESLLRLVSDDDLRAQLAQKGYQKAQQREQRHLAEGWRRLIEECLGNPAPESSQSRLQDEPAGGLA